MTFCWPARDKAGRSLLHTAVLYGNVEVVKFLIDQYPHLINTTDNVRGSPCIHLQSHRKAVIRHRRHVYLPVYT